MAVEFDQLFQDIQGRWYTEVEVALSVQTEYPNHGDGFTPPDDGSIWARLTVLPGDSFMGSFGAPGSNLFRTPGVIEAQFFAKPATSWAALLDKASSAANAFRAVNVGSMVYLTPRVTTVGLVQNWWQVNVTCPFHRDEYA